jgi:hypothetical protein
MQCANLAFSKSKILVSGETVEEKRCMRKSAGRGGGDYPTSDQMVTTERNGNDSNEKKSKKVWDHEASGTESQGRRFVFIPRFLFMIL